MKGMTFSATLEMRFNPPMTTSPTHSASTSPPTMVATE